MQVVYPQESTESTKRGVLANGNGVSTAVYAVVNQELGTIAKDLWQQRHVWPSEVQPFHGSSSYQHTWRPTSSAMLRMHLLDFLSQTYTAGWISVCRCIGSKTTVNTSSSWPLEFTRSKITKRLLGTMSQQQKILQISEVGVEA